MHKRIVVGCMTGTSIDAVDAACLRIEGAGLDICSECVGFASHPLGAIAEPLRAFADQRAMSAGELAELMHEFSRRHVAAIHAALAAAGRPRVDLIAVHGQTVFHRAPLSVQLVAPTPIAHEFACEVVFDLRAADLAAGGQGAPITPLADYVLYRSPGEERVVLNLGGFCNYTWLPAGHAAAEGGAEPGAQARTPHEELLSRVLGGDICVCNQLLDALARRLLGAPYDEGGQTAAGGEAVAALERELAARLTAQARTGRSLGTGDELREWMDRACAGPFRPADVLRSACRAVAATIATWLAGEGEAWKGRGGAGLRAGPAGPTTRVGMPARPTLTQAPGEPALQSCGGNESKRVIVAGGGVRNRALLAALQERLPWPVDAADAFGPGAAEREAAAMAVLAALAQDGVPITLGQVTRRGDSKLTAGAWILPLQP